MSTALPAESRRESSTFEMPTSPGRSRMPLLLRSQKTTLPRLAKLAKPASRVRFWLLRATVTLPVLPVLSMSLSLLVVEPGALRRVGP